ncbi:tetracycline resistance protein, class C [mine drainage metagenome]|uniref:Tetracycline resistance protein, class C n=1 Tax=mine drainage metagenome TaxID=410659 RepID=A0A1J5SAG1_9ZZZZ
MTAIQQARRPAVGFIFVTMTLSVLGFGLLIPVLPDLVTQFQGGHVDAGSHAYGILVGVYALLQFIGSPILGALSDRLGRRKVILIALAGASIDYLIMANAPNMTWLFIGRMISGFTAGVMATANAYIADVTPPEKRAQSYGLLGAAFGIGFVFGPMVGGLLGSISLRLPFWFAAGCAGLNWMYGFFLLPESLAPENRRAFDWKRANPIGALKALKRFPAARGLADAYFILMLAQMMLFSTWVLYMGYRFHWTTIEVGVSLGISGIMMGAVQAGLVKRIVARFGDERTALAGFAISVASYIAYGLATKGWMIYAIIVLGSFGGIAGPAMQSFLSKQVPANEQGGVQGIFSGLSSLAGIPGPLIGAWSFGWAVAHRRSWHIPGIAFFEAAVFIALAMVLTARTFRKAANAR